MYDSEDVPNLNCNKYSGYAGLEIYSFHFPVNAISEYNNKSKLASNFHISLKFMTPEIVQFK
jgi:hypothetical protein